jgi:serine phosphatase RsbU (regulator of sigma subunit)
MASAGHPAPYLNGQEIAIAGTLPLGLAGAGEYPGTVVQLRAGDHLALYTDGLVEARAASGELFSFERVGKLFAGRPNAAQATAAAVSFGQEDDITVLTLTRVQVGEESRTELVAPALTPVYGKG